jgi:structural hemagglutinin/hemolysin toxin protein RtxA
MAIPDCKTNVFMYKICFYVPENYLEIVKSALFKAGAGFIGNYSNCSWQTLGQGQFLALSNSNPSIGVHHQLEKVLEYKVELVCSKEHINNAINALKASHPYETPAYYITEILLNL